MRRVSERYSRRCRWALAVWIGVVSASFVITEKKAEAWEIMPPTFDGRWNITVSDNGREYPSWLHVFEKDGERQAMFLGGPGSPALVEDLKIEKGIFEIKKWSPAEKVVLEKVISFKAWGREWTGEFENWGGERIEGTFKTKDGSGKWVAERYYPKANVNGTWNLKSGGRKVSLILERPSSGSGRIDHFAGKWIEDGKENKIGGTVQDTTMWLWLMGDKGDVTPIGQGMFIVKGNTIVQVNGNTIFESKSYKELKDGITGTREPKWGEPIVLLDGKEADLENWGPLGQPRDKFSWKIVDGVLTNGRDGTENIVTKRKDFRNFKLHVEFKVPEGGNSGIFLRGRYEVQVADSFNQKVCTATCGSLYARIEPLVNACKKPDEWQTFDIEIVNNYLTVVHNDKTIIDNQEIEGITGGAINSHENEPGPIYLQGDHSQIWYRKIILTPME